MNIDKNTIKAKMDIALIGKRIKLIREQILKITQADFAKLVNSRQNLISRLEAGKGTNVNTILDIIKVLQNGNYPAEMIFSNDFEIGNFIRTNLKEEKKKRIIKILDGL